MLDIQVADFKKLSEVSFHNFQYPESANIQSISTDSRTIAKDEVFWVLSGPNFDGHDFVEKAFEQQPQFIVIEQKQVKRFENKGIPFIAVPDTLVALQELAQNQRNKYDIPVFALTGSNGKTTTKEMIATILEQKLQVHKTAGNLNNHIGCPLTLLKMNANQQAAIIEMGTNHPGEIVALAKITNPTQALVTNIGAAHLEFFKDKETVAKEKLSLFDKLPGAGISYKNMDDPFIAAYEGQSATEVTFAIENNAQVTAQLMGLNSLGQAKFKLNNNTEIQLQVPGVHNARNALAAAAVALQFDFSESEIKDALESYANTDKRMQVVELNGVHFLNDAYNANPDSAAAALQAVAQMDIKGDCYLLLGDMFELGTKALEMHIQLLQEAVKISGCNIFVTGKMMQQAAKELEQVTYFETKSDIISQLKDQLKSGDLVLLKGSRGMQMEKILTELN